jgi:hypothetical protein
VTVRQLARFLLALSATLGSVSAWATGVPSWWSADAPPNVVEDRFRLEINVFYPSFDTKVRVDPSLTTLGTPLSGEDDLGLDNSKVLADAELTLLPGKHHLIRLSGFQVRRSGTSVLDKQVVFDQDVYNVGEVVDTHLNLTLVGLTYGYRFTIKGRAEITPTFGIQLAQVDANVIGHQHPLREADQGAAPVPFIGLEGRFDFTPRWGAEVRASYLTANISGIDGSIIDARAGVTWRLNPHFVFGLGYRIFDVDIESRKDTAPGILKMNMDGALVFMRGSL